jgi:hypothetical protein
MIGLGRLLDKSRTLFIIIFQIQIMARYGTLLRDDKDYTLLWKILEVRIFTSLFCQAYVVYIWIKGFLFKVTWSYWCQMKFWN